MRGAQVRVVLGHQRRPGRNLQRPGLHKGRQHLPLALVAVCIESGRRVARGEHQTAEIPLDGTGAAVLEVGPEQA
jgi:hypothetical protein